MPRLSQLNPTAFPTLEHEFPVSKDGETVKLTIAQVRALMQFAATEITVDESTTVMDALNALSNLKADRSYVDEELNAKLDAVEFTDQLNTVLRYDPQTLDGGQQQQTLQNIGAQPNLGRKPVSGNIITPAGANAAIVPVPAGCGSLRISGSIKSDAVTYMRVSSDGGLTYLSGATDYIRASVNTFHIINTASPTANSAEVIAALGNGDAIVPTQFLVEIDSPVPLGGNLPRFRTLSFGITDSSSSGSMYKYESYGASRSPALITHVLLFTDDASVFGAGTRFIAEAF